MKVGIMQPYFMPYIGYFQLLNLVDKFVVYDDIQYTKNSWINRNRYLVNGKAAYLTLPLKRASDYLDVRERHLSDSYQRDSEKLLRSLSEAYRKAPFFNEIYPLVEDCCQYSNNNLFDFILNSIIKIKCQLGIETEILVSSDLQIGRNLKGKDRVIATCHKLGSDNYINSIGGQQLYDKKEFFGHGIKLDFIETIGVPYKQFNGDHVPFLSIIDVMMFNSSDAIKNMFCSYKLV